MAILPTAPTDLADRLAGDVIAPDHPDYEPARQVLGTA